ncbi:putative elongation factor-like protein [Gregarina niphandrodes]|uniref:Elongation factor-like protein n=1 Tax=Gregarina niphandrodes TaxID=110365 RepID=A0A023B763_GRENI|nr:putative elongation factor-like protein [Gregarina niphandrodes]EZG66982.1 putative elongation factor-like protein [Gregarina niphandrodes]|eukprot:XP_011130369.1 putative elongation factor-like protein [Gregarina niphandrodes]
MNRLSAAFLLRSLPLPYAERLVRSLTLDNGSAMADFERLTNMDGLNEIQKGAHSVVPLLAILRFIEYWEYPANPAMGPKPQNDCCFGCLLSYIFRHRHWIERWTYHDSSMTKNLCQMILDQMVMALYRLSLSEDCHSDYVTPDGRWNAKLLAEVGSDHAASGAASGTSEPKSVTLWNYFAYQTRLSSPIQERAHLPLTLNEMSDSEEDHRPAPGDSRSAAQTARTARPKIRGVSTGSLQQPQAPTRRVSPVGGYLTTTPTNQNSAVQGSAAQSSTTQSSTTRLVRRPGETVPQWSSELELNKPERKTLRFPKHDDPRRVIPSLCKGHYLLDVLKKLKALDCLERWANFREALCDHLLSQLLPYVKGDPGTLVPVPSLTLFLSLAHPNRTILRGLLASLLIKASCILLRHHHVAFIGLMMDTIDYEERVETLEKQISLQASCFLVADPPESEQAAQSDADSSVYQSATGGSAIGGCASGVSAAGGSVTYCIAQNLTKSNNTTVDTTAETEAAGTEDRECLSSRITSGFLRRLSSRKLRVSEEEEPERSPVLLRWLLLERCAWSRLAVLTWHWFFEARVEEDLEAVLLLDGVGHEEKLTVLRLLILRVNRDLESGTFLRDLDPAGANRLCDSALLPPGRTASSLEHMPTEGSLDDFPFPDLLEKGGGGEATGRETDAIMRETDATGKETDGIGGDNSGRFNPGRDFSSARDFSTGGDFSIGDDFSTPRDSYGGYSPSGGYSVGESCGGAAAKYELLARARGLPLQKTYSVACTYLAQFVSIDCDLLLRMMAGIDTKGLFVHPSGRGSRSKYYDEDCWPYDVGEEEEPGRRWSCVIKECVIPVEYHWVPSRKYLKYVLGIMYNCILHGRKEWLILKSYLQTYSECMPSLKLVDHLLHQADDEWLQLRRKAAPVRATGRRRSQAQSPLAGQDRSQPAASLLGPCSSDVAPGAGSLVASGALFAPGGEVENQSELTEGRSEKTEIQVHFTGKVASDAVDGASERGWNSEGASSKSEAASRAAPLPSSAEGGAAKGGSEVDLYALIPDLDSCWTVLRCIIDDEVCRGILQFYESGCILDLIEFVTLNVTSLTSAVVGWLKSVWQSFQMTAELESLISDAILYSFDMYVNRVEDSASGLLSGLVADVLVADVLEKEALVETGPLVGRASGYFDPYQLTMSMKFSLMLETLAPYLGVQSLQNMVEYLMMSNVAVCGVAGERGKVGITDHLSRVGTGSQVAACLSLMEENKGTLVWLPCIKVLLRILVERYVPESVRQCYIDDVDEVDENTLREVNAYKSLRVLADKLIADLRCSILNISGHREHLCAALEALHSILLIHTTCNTSLLSRIVQIWSILRTLLEAPIKVNETYFLTWKWVHTAYQYAPVFTISTVGKNVIEDTYQKSLVLGMPEFKILMEDLKNYASFSETCATGGRINIAMDVVRKALLNPKQLRNVCVVAHVDHGKTSVCDHLVASNGYIAARLAGKTRFMDSREDEQRRLITIKSSSIPLLYRPSRGTAELSGIVESSSCEQPVDEYVINLIDSPGHVDFSVEVTAATRLCDGALIVVDVLEGLRSQTKSVMRQCIAEGLKPMLVLNKMDRLFGEAHMSHGNAYTHLRDVVESVNAYLHKCVTDTHSRVSERNVSSKMDNEHGGVGHGGVGHGGVGHGGVGHGGVDYLDEVYSALSFDPVKRNVLFASASDGWCCGSAMAAETLLRRLRLPRSKLSRLLPVCWGEWYLHRKSGQISRRPFKGQAADATVGATQLLQTLEQVYKLNAIPPDELAPFISKTAAFLQVEISEREIRDWTRKPGTAAGALLAKWAPLGKVLLGAIVAGLPSPADAYAARIEHIDRVGPIGGDSQHDDPDAWETEDEDDLVADLGEDLSADQDKDVSADQAKDLSADQDKDVSADQDKHLSADQGGEQDYHQDARDVDHDGDGDHHHHHQDNGKLDHDRQVGWEGGIDAQELLRKPCVVFIAKSMHAQLGKLRLTSDSLHGREQAGDFVGFARVFEGRLHEGQRLFVNGSESSQVTVKHLFVPVGMDLCPVAAVGAGAIVCIAFDESGYESANSVDATVRWLLSLKKDTKDPENVSRGFNAVDRCVTLSENARQRPLSSIYLKHPVGSLRFGVTPANLQDWQAFISALALLFRADPAVSLEVATDTGDFIVCCQGQVHQERVVQDLHQLYCPEIQLNITPPLISLRETVCDPPANLTLSKSAREAAFPPWAGARPQVVGSSPGEGALATSLSEGAISSGAISSGATSSGATSSGATSSGATSSGAMVGSCVSGDNWVMAEARPMPAELLTFMDQHAAVLNDVFHQKMVTPKVAHFMARRRPSRRAPRPPALPPLLPGPCQSEIEGDGSWSVRECSEVVLAHIQKLSGMKSGSCVGVCVSSDSRTVAFLADAPNADVVGAIPGSGAGADLVGGSPRAVEAEADLSALTTESNLRSRVRGGRAAGPGSVRAEEVAGSIPRDAESRRRELNVDWLRGTLRERAALATRHALDSASRRGPICEEPVRGVIWTVTQMRTAEAESSTGEPATMPTSSSASRVATGALGPLMGCAKTAMRNAMETRGAVRVWELMLLFEIQCSEEVFGRVHDIVSSKRGTVLSQDIQETTLEFVLVVEMPSSESFTLSVELRKHTSGKATFIPLRSYWKLNPDDPFPEAVLSPEEEEEAGAKVVVSANVPRNLLNLVRQRKGLPLGGKVVEERADKQRTLGKNV